MSARIAVLLLALGACAPAAEGMTDASKDSDARTATRTAPIDDAIARGVAYLVKSQNKDGSWGSPASNLYDIYAPVPGSYQTFQVASTALDAAALLECDSKVAGAADALRRATEFLLAHHEVKRISPDTLYNTWAHAYSLEFFSRCMAREKDPARRAEFAKAAAADVDRLTRYEFVDGGWGYYDFDYFTQKPAHGATSFTTASCLLALDMAAKQGVTVPQRLVDRAVALIETCRVGPGIYAYDFDLRYRPLMGVNHLEGSLARTPACLVALDAWGRKCSQSVAEDALDNLEKDGRFLQIARKYPRPHETWYQNSGYFCFYGYHYATRLASLLPESRRAPHLAKIAQYMVSVQEKDGSFWDYQLYGYHKAYGTGYALLSLANCR